MISIFINSMTSGGAEKVVLTLIENIIEQRGDVQLICLEKEEYYELPENTNPPIYLTDKESAADSILKYPLMIASAWRLRRMVEEKDIKMIQCHLLRAMFVSVLAQLMGSRHQTQIVLHSRINFDRDISVVQGLKKWIYKKILFQANTVISICDTMKLALDDYLDLKHHRDHRRIYNPHDIDNILELSKGTVLEEELLQHSFLLSVGRLVAGKRLDEQILAFSKLKNKYPELQLVFIGDGVLLKSLKQQASDLGCSDAVHFLGYKSNPYPYIRKAEITVLSSEWEGLPNMLIESLVCGTAIVSSDCISGPREILSPESQLTSNLKEGIEIAPYGVLYPVGNVDSLIEAIDLTLSDKAAANIRKENGFERAKVFDADNIATIYRRLGETTN